MFRQMDSLHLKMDGIMLMACVFAVMLLTSSPARASMITRVAEELVVNNGKFTIVISSTTGKIISAKVNDKAVEISCQNYPYTLFFPEFETPDSTRTYLGGDCKWVGYYGTTSVEVAWDDGDLAVIGTTWETGLIDVFWVYRFIYGTNYFVVYTWREVKRTGIYTNAQQCVMVNKMDDSYIVNYEGDLVCNMRNKIMIEPGLMAEYSMFTAIDNGRGRRYPGFAWHEDSEDVTAGVFVTNVTPNQRETISYHGGGTIEGQFNLFGKADDESIYLKSGTNYGMELYYYLDSGDIDQFDAFNMAVFNERHYDVERSENYCAASWGGRRCSEEKLSWNYPQISSNYICSQQLVRHRSISIPRSQNGVSSPPDYVAHPHLVDLIVKMSDPGGEFDLSPINGKEIVHETASTTVGENFMVGEMSWKLHGVENILRYKLFDGSDKMIVSGEVSVIDSLDIEELYIDLMCSPRVREISRVDEGIWDIRANDTIYGTIGIALYDVVGVERITRENLGGASPILRLHLLENDGDRPYLPGNVFTYGLKLFPHIGYNVEAKSTITPLLSAPVQYYREIYKTLPGLREFTGIGMKPCPKAMVYDAALSSEEGTIAEIKVYADQGNYPLRFFVSEEVKGVSMDEEILPASAWNYSEEDSVLSVAVDWDGKALLELFSVPCHVEETEEPGEALELRILTGYSGNITLNLILPEPGFVTLTVYNVLGQRVKSLVRRYEQEGAYRIAWDGRDDSGTEVSIGLYLCRLRINGKHRVEKILLLR